MTIDLGLLLAVIGSAVIAGAAFFVVGRRIERRVAEVAGQSVKQQAERILSEARRDAEAGRAASVIAAKEEIIKAREGWETEAQRRRQEAERHEKRMEERETLVDRKLNALDERDKDLQRREQAVVDRDKALAKRDEEVARAMGEHRARLEQLAGLSAQEAKEQLKQAVTDEARSEASALVRDIKEEAKKNGDREAKKIVAMAIQRIAAETTAETTVSSVTLPNDEMKGRIIGREGRNIRAFETATGVDVIIDDTPDTVVISCFDPVRREVARQSLEQLISDGRIHPGRIEEVVNKVRAQIEVELVQAGEQAAYELGIHGLHAELIKLVGRMKYRTSYGQNIYYHSKEVAWLAGMMAAELKIDVHLAKRGGLLHDVGKVMTHDHEGTHVELGVEMATKYGEHPVVINAIAAHHDDVPHETPISVIVQAADRVSGARPGARREAFETYVKRLTKLEEIATSYPGVERSFAIQAGRELRIVVVPEAIDDVKAQQLSEQIARRIETELQYPGQIRVVVIRETRAVDVAR
ncbi:MAG: ribonuclease Y [Gemmatimonadetes bacterium]|nr:ribonuclease Y [Gemmatimonadota bacterium]